MQKSGVFHQIKKQECILGKGFQHFPYYTGMYAHLGRADMARYGVIVTEKVQPEDGVVHWLKRGTVVQIVRDWDVKCVLPCYPINMAVTDMGFKAHSQSVNPEDVLEIPPDQLAAIQAK
jgi:hypothetical protein